MKKTLVALAALAATAAFAQSTVTLSGQIAYGYQQNPLKDKGFTNTDMGFTLSAVEDLGGGLSAFANVTYDTTGSTFASTPLRRNSAIGLRGTSFGQFSIGNTRSSDLLTRAWVAPSSLPDGIYDSSGILTRTPIDVVTYAAKIDAFTPSISYVESAADGATTPALKTVVLQLDYANGPLAAGIAYKTTSGLAVGIRKSNLELAATYDFGVARVGFGYDSKPAGIAKTAGKNAFALGVAFPIGAATVGLNYAKRDAFKATELAAQYNLSKRTFVNFSAGKQNADANSQYRIKLHHNF